jgi:endonuclease/exonuclease/phosphatase family metal-dependent hydrolase
MTHAATPPHPTFFFPSNKPTSQSHPPLHQEISLAVMSMRKLNVAVTRSASRKTKDAENEVVEEVAQEDKPIEGGDAVRLVCFNVHNGFADASDRKCTFAQTIEWLRGQAPDVVCFQEVSWRFVSQAHVEKEIRTKLGLQHIVYGYAATLYGVFFGQMTCSRFPIAHEENLALKPDPMEGEGRSALITQLTLDSGATLTVLNTHLDAWDDTDKTRLAQAKQILAHVKKMRKTAPHTAVLLVGDFNSVRAEDLDLTAEDFEEQAREHLVLNHLMAKGGAQDVFDRLGVRAENPRPRGNPWRIDFAWLLPPHDAIQVTAARFAAEAKMSDHFPIVTNLLVRAAEA